MNALILSENRGTCAFLGLLLPPTHSFRTPAGRGRAEGASFLLLAQLQHSQGTGRSGSDWGLGERLSIIGERWSASMDLTTPIGCRCKAVVWRLKVLILQSLNDRISSSPFCMRSHPLLAHTSPLAPSPRSAMRHDAIIALQTAMCMFVRPWPHLISNSWHTPAR